MSKLWTKAVVVARRDVAPSIAVFDLKPVDGSAFPSFDAGAHIDVCVGSERIVRQYSLCPSAEGVYRIAVLHTNPSRGGSQAMHALVQGDHLEISGPRNLFGLTDADRHVLLAGGIGITPLLSMAKELHDSGRDYSLHYVIRDPAGAAFVRELEAHPNVVVHVTGGIPSRRPNPAELLGVPAAGTAVYVCGPDGFMDQMVAGAVARGWPQASILTERFTAADSGAVGAEFKIRLASTGVMYAVPPDRSVLDVLRANGVRVPFSCQQGMCGECVLNVKSGEPDHRDDVLTDEERAEGAFTICVSRSQGPMLELDI